MIKQISQLVVAIIILAVAQPAQAQWSFNPNLAPSLLWPVVNNPCPNGNCGGSKKPKQDSSAGEKLSSSKLLFKPSATARQTNLKRFIDNFRQTNPAGVDQVKQLFESTDVVNQVGQKMVAAGLKPNNLADAYAVYWTNAWLGTRGRNENLPKSQIFVVRNQAASALLKVPEFTAATDTQKQELTEALLIQTALIDASIESAKSDPELLAQVQKAIAQGAEAFGLDLYSMNLTPQGFRPTKR